MSWADSTPPVTAYTWAAPKEVAPHWLALLSPAEHAELSQHRSAENRQQRVAARALLRGLLWKVAGAAVARAPLRRLSSGALVLEGAPAITVNVSHTRGLAAAAISTEGQVGIDVEFVDLTLDHAAVTARFYHADERAALARLPPLQRRAAFFALWTGKEAVAKALGMGLERELLLQSFALQCTKPTGWVVQGITGVHAAYPVPAPAGYHAALALVAPSVAQPNAAARFIDLRHN